MSLLLDAGGLVALERGDALAHALLKRALHAGVPPRTHGAVLGQVWRGGSGRQARLARVLATLEVVPVDSELGERAGVLLGRARMNDVVDAALIVLAVDGDSILTSDPEDLAALADAAGVHIDLVVV
jgi:hypothetical protein